jgi:hypothetical protein
LKEKHDDIVLRQTTFTDWTDCDSHPRTFLEISDEELECIVTNPEYLFARKITESTLDLEQKLDKYNIFE